MKLRSLLLILSFSFFANAFAANVHFNPKATEQDKSSPKRATYPGNCRIDFVNHTSTPVTVFGTSDEGDSIVFDIYGYESAAIDMFYNGFCHPQMYIKVQSPFYVLYAGWVDIYRPVDIVYYLKQAKLQFSTR